MGLGNVDGGDDGFGVRLAKALIRAGVPDVVVAGVAPEPFLSRIVNSGIAHLVFMDAVDFGAAPGSVVFLNSQEMTARFPQISTHRLSVGTLARLVEEGGRIKAWLLGAQPNSLERSAALSPALRTTMVILTALIGSVVGEGVES
jgi:hydrogenase maturation protease